MNLPNFLTILRIFFVPLLVAVLVQQDFRSNIAALDAYKDFWALAIFLAAAATDLLDGYLARRWQQITTVGTLLDPIADKLLISAALISLVQIRRVPGWMVVVIVGREFAVTGLRSIAAAEGYTIKASDLGKTKMVAQVVAISLVMLSIHWPELAQASEIALWAVVLFGLASAVGYFMKFWRKVDDSIKKRRRRELLLLERQKKRASMLRPAATTSNRSAQTGSAGPAQ
jgi:CDP-diacylglycerol--glycerol-3-phosphate 3-phosphatidyltransferase